MPVPVVNKFSSLRRVCQDGLPSVLHWALPAKLALRHQRPGRGAPLCDPVPKGSLRSLLDSNFASSPALPDFTPRTPRGRSGGPTLPFFTINRASSDAKIASPQGLLQVKFDFTGLVWWRTWTDLLQTSWAAPGGLVAPSQTHNKPRACEPQGQLDVQKSVQTACVPSRRTSRGPVTCLGE